jgi:hypothetical protein
MTPELDAIKEFALSHMDAHDNPRKLIEARNIAEECTRVSNECAERMKRCRRADEAILKLDDIAVYEQTRDYIAAENDKGCGRCWLSSVLKDNHKECEDKIARWFKARNNLIAFGAVLVVEDIRRGERKSC